MVLQENFPILSLRVAIPFSIEKSQKSGDCFAPRFDFAPQKAFVAPLSAKGLAMTDVQLSYLMLPAVTPLVSDLWKSTKKIIQGMMPSNAAEL